MRILVSLIILLSFATLSFAGEKEDLAVKIITLQQELQVLSNEYKSKSEEVLKLQDKFKQIIANEKKEKKSEKVN